MKNTTPTKSVFIQDNIEEEDTDIDDNDDFDVLDDINELKKNKKQKEEKKTKDDIDENDDDEEEEEEDEDQEEDEQEDIDEYDSVDEDSEVSSLLRERKQKIKKTASALSNIDESEIADNEKKEEFFNTEFYDKFVIDNDIDILDCKKYGGDSMHKQDLIVPRDNRKTSEIMTIYEYTRIISERAKQIENGSPIFIDIGKDYDPIKIAKKEIVQKKCPLKITRYLNKYIKEEWEVNELSIPFQ